MAICEYCNSEHDGGYASGRFCNKQCARGFSTKSKRYTINLKVSEKLKGRYTTPEPTCNRCKIEIPRSQSKFCDNCRAIIRSTNISNACKGKTGGWRKNSGRGKYGYYHNHWFQSSWELAWIIYAVDNNINFKRNTNGFEYEFENKLYKFYPDFILENETYLEIKGWTTERDKCKFKHFPQKLIIISGKREIKPYIEYAVSKFGKHFATALSNIS